MSEKKDSIIICHLENDPQYVIPIASNVSILFENKFKDKLSTSKYDFIVSDDGKNMEFGEIPSDPPFGVQYVCVEDTALLDEILERQSKGILLVLDYHIKLPNQVTSIEKCKELVEGGAIAPQNVVFFTGYMAELEDAISKAPSLAKIEILRKGGPSREIVTYLFDWITKTTGCAIEDDQRIKNG